MAGKPAIPCSHGAGFLKEFTGASPDPETERRLTATLNRLYGFYKTEIDLSLNRTYRFLERLGNPHLRLPPVVHIAGTNGKGSTTAALRAFLEQAGQSVHVYTSPHLVHPTERIRLAGIPIRSEDLLETLTECLDLNADEPITFFEMFTCAAFLAFNRVAADWLLLETGMGGRLDTTNVISAPAVTVITTVSYDHQSFLGGTIKEIALQKAGIMKPGVPCVVGRQSVEPDAVLETIHTASTRLSPEAPLMRFGAEWRSDLESNCLMFRYGNDSIPLPTPNLAGEHQIWNVGAALAAFRIIAPEHFRPEILSPAIRSIAWPARLQILQDHPYNALAPGWTVILDGGHNDSAGSALANTLAQRRLQDNRPVYLVAAMVDRKDPLAFLGPLAAQVDGIVLTEIEGENTSFRADDLASVASRLNFRSVSTAPSPRDAVIAIASEDPQTGIILIAGSLFLAGNVLAED